MSRDFLYSPQRRGMAYHGTRREECRPMMITGFEEENIRRDLLKSGPGQDWGFAI
jgi:hypothetical protein